MDFDDPMSAPSDATVTRLWRVMRTVQQLLLDRGYIVFRDSEPPFEDDLSLKSFRDRYTQGDEVLRDRMTLIGKHKDNHLLTIMVIFDSERSLGIKQARKIGEAFIENGIKRGIVIHSGSITPSAAKILSGLVKRVDVERFQEDDLLVNVTKHVLVPKHEVLDDDAKAALLAK